VRIPLLPLAFAIGALLATICHAQNLLQNPGFETGSSPWFGIGATYGSSRTQARTGLSSGRQISRTQPWNGIGQSLLGRLTPGRDYRITAWLRVENAATAPVLITVKLVDAAGTNYTGVVSGTATSSGWTRFESEYAYRPTGAVTELVVYAEGPPSGVNLYVDDAEVVELADWRVEADARIEQIRKRTADITVSVAGAGPVQGAQVSVRQTRRHFAFGSAINTNTTTNATYREFVRQHFEWAVLENEAKWPGNEPQRGNVTYAAADPIVAFCRQNNIKLRGHTIFWEVGEFVPPWLPALSNTDLRLAMQRRLSSWTAHFRGDFLHYDVNNEMTHGNFYSSRLGTSIWTWMFQSARNLDPAAKLFVNDYNNIDGSETETYYAHIQTLLAAGTPIDGIGCQAHYFSPVNPRTTLANLDRLAQFGLPIWITEFDYASANDANHAENIETFYRAAFSHPAVDGILMWGFWAGAHWRGADAALVRQDWSLRPGGQRYLDLLAAWRTDASGATDTDGAWAFRGFHGDYEARIEVPGRDPFVTTFTLAPGAGVQDVVLTLPACPADFNADGFLDFFDFDDFVACFEGSACPPGKSADFNADGFVDFFDFDDFVAAFEAGC
jgi:endo-1,4-beta-xylanase